MNLDSARKTGNFLQYVAQPVLMTAASIGFYAICKNRVPGSSVAAMVVVHSVTSHFFATKAVDLPRSNIGPVVWNHIAIPFVATFASTQLRMEGKDREGIVCLAILGVIYASISYMLHSAAKNIIIKDIEQKQRKEIETQLGRTIQLTEPMQQEILATWKIIDDTIKRISDEPNAQKKEALLFSSFYQPAAPLEKTFANLTDEAKMRVLISLAKQNVTLFNSKVFALEKYPDLIFKKISREDFELLISHQLVCQREQLTELVIPPSKFLEIDGMTFVVQQKLVYHEAKQCRYYFKYAERLEQAVLQLHTYIIKTGESDVEWRNMPVIGNVKDKNGKLQIALIDHEKMPGDNWPEWGIVGYEPLKRTGLIGLLCKEQARKVAKLSLSALPKFGKEINQALQRRVAELKTYQQELTRNQNFKQWALARNRKSNEPILNMINIPSNVTHEQFEIMKQILRTFNQGIAQRNPKNFPSRYDFRTIDLIFTPPFMAIDSEYFDKIEAACAMLKTTQNIFDYKITFKSDNPIFSFSKKMIVSITA